MVDDIDDGFKSNQVKNNIKNEQKKDTQSVPDLDFSMLRSNEVNNPSQSVGTLSSSEATPGVLGDEKFGVFNADDFGISKDNVEDFNEILDRDWSAFNTTLREDVAKEQTKSRIAGNALAQTLAELTIGTAEAFTYVLDVPGVVQSFTGGEDDQPEYGNWLGDILGEQKESINNEAFNIYKTEKAQNSFAIGDATWWGNNVATIASTATIFIPGLGAVKAASLIGKMSKVALAGRVSKISKLGKIGKTAEYMNKANNFVSSQRAANIGSTVVSGATSRYVEGTMEAAGTVDEYKANFTQKWMAENPGMTANDMPQDLKDQMQMEASHAGLANFRANIAMLPIDLMQAGMFFGTFGRANKKLASDLQKNIRKEMYDSGVKGATKVDDVVEGAAKTASKTAEKAGKKAAEEITEDVGEGFVKGAVKGAKKTAKKGKSALSAIGKAMSDKSKWTTGGKNLVSNAVFEATEEGYQYMSSKWSQNIQDEENDWGDALGITLKDGFQDPDLYTSMFFGAFGGVALGSVLPGLAKGLKIGAHGWKGSVSSEDVLKEKLVKARAEALGDKGGYHRVDSKVMRELGLTHALAGSSEELQMALDESIKIAKENPNDYSEEDVAELENKSKLHKKLTEGVDYILGRSDYNSMDKKAFSRFEADFIFGKDVMDKANEAFEAKVLDGDRVDMSEYKLEYVKKILKDGNILSKTKQGRAIFDAKIAALEAQIAKEKVDFKC